MSQSVEAYKAEAYVFEYGPRCCDKCGELVPAHNSVLYLQEFIVGWAGLVSDRHLYPTATCEGSPSRVRLVQENNLWQQAYQDLEMQP